MNIFITWIFSRKVIGTAENYRLQFTALQADWNENKMKNDQELVAIPGITNFLWYFF